MKSEKLKGLSTTSSYNYYTSFSVKTLPREKDRTDFSTTARESDVEEYYPFVIGRGKSFQIVDPKVYKQLRKNNIRQSKHIRIAECAKKTSTKSKTTEGIKSSVTSESEDEYCELSALAKSPAPLLPPRKITQVRKDCSRDSVKTVPSCEKRRQNEYYDPKQCMVQFNSNSSTVTTKFVSSADVLKKSSWKDSEKPIVEENFYEPTKKCFCGLETDEVVDYTTCMCCVKGLFYHCTKDSEDEGRMADDPCSCSGPLKTCIPRWGCLAVFSVFLPCLWCFLPITGCRKAAKCVSCKNKKHERKSKKIGRKSLDFISQKQQQQ